MTPPILTAIILHYGWRAAFVFSACAGAAAGLVWYLASRDTPEEHPWVSDSERALIVSGRRVSKHGRERSVELWKAHDSVGEYLRSRAIYALTLSYFAFGYVAWMFFAWMYIYMAQVRGLNLKTQRDLRDVSVYRDDGWMPAGRRCQRLDCGALRSAHGPLPAAGSCAALTAVLLLLGSRAHDAQTAALVLASGQACCTFRRAASGRSRPILPANTPASSAA